jgi:hypothetical protein
MIVNRIWKTSKMGKHHPARKGSLIIGSYKPPEQIDNPKNYNNKTITRIHPAEEKKCLTPDVVRYRIIVNEQI